MNVKFWGVRGSIPVPGPTTVRYGGNTSCLEVTGAGGECIILEGGSGIRPLGLNLLKRGFPLPEINFFISHTHWDHIQGVPFFVPNYIPGTKIHVKGPVHYSDRMTLKEVFDIQMRYEFFPISENQLGAALDYETIGEATMDIGDVTVQTQFTNHPIRSIGFRLTEFDRTLVYMGDHEPYYNIFDQVTEDEEEGEDDLLFGDVDNTVDDANARFVDFLRGADVIILDSQYTPEEYQKDKRNWGHSSWDYCLQWMRDSGAKKMVLTHHEPTRSDDQMDEMLQNIRNEATKMGMNPEAIHLSVEGLELEI